MSRLAELEARIDAPTGILTDDEIAEYLALRDAQLQELRRKADAEARARTAAKAEEEQRLAALHGVERIKHALQKIKAA